MQKYAFVLRSSNCTARKSQKKVDLKKKPYYAHVIQSYKFWLEKLSKKKTQLLRYCNLRTKFCTQRKSVVNVVQIFELGTIQLKKTVTICKFKEVMVEKPKHYVCSTYIAVDEMRDCKTLSCRNLLNIDPNDLISFLKDSQFNFDVEICCFVFAYDQPFPRYLQLKLPICAQKLSVSNLN